MEGLDFVKRLELGYHFLEFLDQAEVFLSVEFPFIF